MRGKRTFLRLGLMIVAVVAFWAAGTTANAGPWGDLISLKSVDTDPDKQYNVADENGPWMIMASTFSGDGAEKQARELVMELRTRYKTTGFLFFTYVSIYALGRLVLSFVRTESVWFWGLQEAQVVAIAILLCAAVAVYILSRRSKLNLVPGATMKTDYATK